MLNWFKGHEHSKCDNDVILENLSLDNYIGDKFIEGYWAKWILLNFLLYFNI